MLRVALVFMAIMLIIYCVVDVAQSDGAEVRRAPRWLWAAAVIALPVVGAVAWLAFGRPNARSIAEHDRERFPIAPDDDNDFLRGLK